MFCYFFCFHRNLRDRRDRSPLSLTDYRSKRRILEIDRDRFFYRVEDLTLVLLRYVANISMFSFRSPLFRRGGKSLQSYSFYFYQPNFLRFIFVFPSGRLRLPASVSGASLSTSPKASAKLLPFSFSTKYFQMFFSLYPC